MANIRNRFIAAALVALLFLSMPGIAGVSVTPTARNLEQNGAIVPSFALIPYLNQLQNNGAPIYGTNAIVSVSNAAGTTITAGNMVGAWESRVGASVAVSDTTDTALNIIGAIPGAGIGSTAVWTIQNLNLGLLTLVGGTGVTLAGQLVVPFNQTWQGLISVATGNVGSATVTQQGAGYSSTSLPTVTISGSSCSGVTATAVVPAGANYVSGITITGAGSACVGTPTCTIGAPSATNSTVQATCTATVVPTTVTITGFNTVPTTAQPNTSFASVATGNGTAAAGALTGSNYVVYAPSGATALTTRTATQMFADTPNASAGLSYVLRVYNTNGGTLTLTGGTGVTITGTATIATNVFRDYTVSFTSATTLVMQNIGSGVAN